MCERGDVRGVGCVGYVRGVGCVTQVWGRHTDKLWSSRYRDIGNLAVAIAILGKSPR